MKKLSEKYLNEYENLTIKDLIELDNRTLNTLMLEIFQKRSEKVLPHEVLDKYKKDNQFYCPSKEDLRVINEYNNVFLSLLPKKYEAIELSPIVPFGSNISFTNLSQKNIATTIKNSEVCSDATTALTLEACKRRQELYRNPETINEEVNLATIKKVLRMQRFDYEKGYLQHFSQFAMLSAGRKKYEFESDKMKEHIESWLKVLLELKKQDFLIGNINVGLCHINIIEHFIQNNFVDRKIITANSFSDFDLFKELKIDLPNKICDFSELSENKKNIYKLNLIKSYINYLSKTITELQEKYPDVNFYIEMDRKGGLGYYCGSCFHIYSEENGIYVPLCDGGTPNWNSKILRDNKETSMVSGIGSELVLNLYRKREV